MLPYTQDSLINLLRQYAAFKGLSQNPNPFLVSLNKEFRNPNTKTGVGNGINAGDIIDNTFMFSFLGLNFITRVEISYDDVKKTFNWGELNTYHIDKEDEEFLIVKYIYNYTGTILNTEPSETAFTVTDFSEPYYMDFFQKFMEYSLKKDIKFPLK